MWYQISNHWTLIFTGLISVWGRLFPQNCAHIEYQICTNLLNFVSIRMHICQKPRNHVLPSRCVLRGFIKSCFLAYMSVENSHEISPLFNALCQTTKRPFIPDTWYHDLMCIMSYVKCVNRWLLLCIARAILLMIIVFLITFNTNLVPIGWLHGEARDIFAKFCFAKWER